MEGGFDACRFVDPLHVAIDILVHNIVGSSIK
jgi:hypothetical protein